MKVKSESEVAQLCSTLSDPMDCSLPGFSIHRIFQAWILEWGAIAFSNIYIGIEQVKVNRQQMVVIINFLSVGMGGYRLAKEKARMNMGDGIILIYMQMDR